MLKLFKRLNNQRIHHTRSRQFSNQDQFDLNFILRIVCLIYEIPTAALSGSVRPGHLTEHGFSDLRDPDSKLSGSVRLRHFAALRLQNVSLTDLKTLLIILCLKLLFQFTANSQVYERPNFTFSSHETLDLERIEVDDSQTRVYFSILNRKLGATFCIDTNTYIKNSLVPGQFNLIESIGVPDCPEVHKFSIVGKKLSFILVFPAIGKDVRYIDIIENCQEACISIRYVLLDTVINDRINKALKLYESRKLEESLTVFEDLMLSHNDNVSPVFGTVYLYMMSINYELGQPKEIRRLYDELEHSSIINKEEILEEIRYQELIR